VQSVRRQRGEGERAFPSVGIFAEHRNRWSTASLPQVPVAELIEDRPRNAHEASVTVSFLSCSRIPVASLLSWSLSLKRRARGVPEAMPDKSPGTTSRRCSAGGSGLGALRRNAPKHWGNAQCFIVWHSGACPRLCAVSAPGEMDGGQSVTSWMMQHRLAPSRRRGRIRGGEL
jgi:hypothetical protein